MAATTKSIALSKRLTSTGSRHDRAWAYVELGAGLRAARDAAGAEHAYDEAASLNPDLWLVWESKADLAAFGEANEERALAFRRRAVAATDFGDADPNVAAHVHLDDQVYIDEYEGDFSAALAAIAKEAEEQSDNSSPINRPTWRPMRRPICMTTPRCANGRSGRRIMASRCANTT